MPITLLAATTDADQSSSYVAKYDDVPITFRCPGLAGAEVGTLQYQDSAGTWRDYYIDGTVQTISATNSDLTIYAFGTYRIDKDATVATVPVELSTSTTP